MRLFLTMNQAKASWVFHSGVRTVRSQDTTACRSWTDGADTNRMCNVLGGYSFFKGLVAQLGCDQTEKDVCHWMCLAQIPLQTSEVQLHLQAATCQGCWQLHPMRNSNGSGAQVHLIQALGLELKGPQNKVETP